MLLQSDLFAVELLNGHIYIHVDLGSGAVKLRASRRRVDDGSWHELTLRRSGREGKVSVDGQWNDFRTPGESTQLELDAPIYIGGTGAAYGTVQWPPAIWTATLRQGFVGCLRDLTLSGKAVDIAAYARQQDSGTQFNHTMEFLSLHCAYQKFRRCETIVSRTNESMWWGRATMPKQRDLQRRMESTIVRLYSYPVQWTDVWQRVDNVGIQWYTTHDNMVGWCAGESNANGRIGIEI